MSARVTPEARKRFSITRAQADVRLVISTLKFMLEDECLERVRDQVREVKRQAESLATRVALECCHCKKPVEFGCNCCARCADERGP